VADLGSSSPELYEEGRISYRLFLESTRELNRARVPGLFDTISHVIAKNNMYSTTLPTPLSRPPAGGGTQTSPPSTPAATTLTPPNSASTSTSGDYDDGRTTDVGSEEDYAHYDTGISSTDYEHLLSDSDDDSDSVELSFVGPVTVVDTPPVNDGTDSAPATARTNTPVFFGPPLPPKMAAARNAATTAAPPTGGIDPTLAALATVVQLQGQAPIFQGPAADYARIWEPLFNPPPMQPPVFPFRYNAMPEGVDFENMTDDDGNDHEHETEDEEAGFSLSLCVSLSFTHIHTHTHSLAHPSITLPLSNYRYHIREVHC